MLRGEDKEAEMIYLLQSFHPVQPSPPPLPQNPVRFIIIDKSFNCLILSFANLYLSNAAAYTLLGFNFGGELPDPLYHI